MDASNHAREASTPMRTPGKNDFKRPAFALGRISFGPDYDGSSSSCSEEDGMIPPCAASMAPPPNRGSSKSLFPTGASSNTNKHVEQPGWTEPSSQANGDSGNFARALDSSSTTASSSSTSMGSRPASTVRDRVGASGGEKFGANCHLAAVATQSRQGSPKILSDRSLRGNRPLDEDNGQHRYPPPSSSSSPSSAARSSGFRTQPSGGANTDSRKYSKGSASSFPASHRGLLAQERGSGGPVLAGEMRGSRRKGIFSASTCVAGNAVSATRAGDGDDDEYDYGDYNDSDQENISPMKASDLSRAAARARVKASGCYSPPPRCAGEAELGHSDTFDGGVGRQSRDSGVYASSPSPPAKAAVEASSFCSEIGAYSPGARSACSERDLAGSVPSIVSQESSPPGSPASPGRHYMEHDTPPSTTMSGIDGDSGAAGYGSEAFRDCLEEAESDSGDSPRRSSDLLLDTPSSSGRPPDAVPSSSATHTGDADSARRRRCSGFGSKDAGGRGGGSGGGGGADSVGRGRPDGGGARREAKADREEWTDDNDDNGDGDSCDDFEMAVAAGASDSERGSEVDNAGKDGDWKRGMGGVTWEIEADQGGGARGAATFSVPAELYERMYPHQRTGVRWLWGLHQGDMGGILGDDMGLGKTFQVRFVPRGACFVAPSWVLVFVRIPSVVKSCGKNGRRQHCCCCCCRLLILYIRAAVLLYILAC